MSDELIPQDKKADEFAEEEEKARARRLFVIAIIVFLFIITVLTFGWFYWKKKEKKEAEREKKKQRLAEVGALIQHLQSLKEKTERTEKIIKIFVRLGIGIILVFLNYAYKYYKISPFEFENDIGKLLNLNACIITGYSFIAFISYGSIDNFVKRMKDILAQILRRNHIHSIEELEFLIQERELLKSELEIKNESFI